MRELYFLGGYLTLMAVVTASVTVTRIVYWSLSTKSLDEMQIFVYGLTYVGWLFNYACLGGFLGVLMCWNEGIRPEFSLGFTPFLPLLYHLTTKRSDRWRRIFFE